MSHIDVTLTELAAGSKGVLTYHELQSTGIDSSAIARRIRWGTVRRHASGVYLVGRSAHRPTDDELLLATVRSFGRDAALSHLSAAARLGMWRRPSGPVQVTSRSHHPVITRRNLVHHRRCDPWDDGCVVAVGDIPTTAPLLTATQLGLCLTCHQLPGVYHEGIFMGHFSLPDLEAAVDAAAGVRGIATVRRGLALYKAGSAGTRSRSEDQLLSALLASWAPEPLVNLRGATGLAGVELDLVWPDEQVVVEVDGRHDRPPNEISDAQVDALLRDQGWLVIRVTADDVWKRLDETVHRTLVALSSRIGSAARMP